jgi:hypothetical protein
MDDKEYIGCDMRREHCYTEIFEQTAFSREFKIFVRSNAMPGGSCSLFGCSTSRKSSLSLNKGDETYKAFKVPAQKEWLRVILRTREMTPDLKKRSDVDENNLFLCCEQQLQ